MRPGVADPTDVVTDHGGSLGRADALFPGAPKPWVDLSTGINPHSYPLFDLPATAFSRLPEDARIQELSALAVTVYGAPAAANVVCAPGTQILLPLVMALVPPGRAAVLSPTYAEHRRAAALVGHAASETAQFDGLFDADLAVVVNPNNPDGRIIARADLLRLARHLAEKGGLLVVDEAFMDVGPRPESVSGDAGMPGLVVLRSFGKFFGLAGVRLGFALADQATVARLSGQLGPWAVSGPTLEYGLRALADRGWQADMRQRLAREAARLDALLEVHGIALAGGTTLFRYVRLPAAASLFDALGRGGVLVRNFSHTRDALRIGLPATDDEFARLAGALGDWSASR
jgi:cobalamin biosynthetic protein CobC